VTAGVEVEVLVAGTIAMPRAYVFPRPGANRLRRVAAILRSEGGTIEAPLLAYVVRHPQAGTLLIDTGLHPDAATSVSRDYGRALGGTLFRGLRPSAASFAEQLRERGVEPGDVRLVVMTHLHVDHTSGMRELPAAEFLCERREWDAATGPRAVLGGYAPHHLPDRSRARLLDVAGTGEPHGPFARTHDLLGDGSVRLVATAGHTAGHLSVLLRREAGGPLLVVGDAAYTRRSIDEQLSPAFTVDESRYRSSLAELGEFARGEPAATLVPTHDPDAWRDVAG
jgi:glyoxylase-like metal-dependent hydrolase (beta-lactamase superfamily II)